VALAGFDDHPWAEVTDPPLTMVQQPARQLGQSAADMLLALIRREPVLEPRLTLPCRLIIRKSSQGPRDQAPALATDPLPG
jgi:LacI family transcriptional regulator